MRILRLCAITLLIGLVIGALGHQIIRGGSTAGTKEEPTASALMLRYRLDAAQSNFMVRTFSGGLVFFKGHDHFIKVGDFTGEAQLTPTAVNPASLQMTIRADSLAETRDVFTPQQKQIINKEIRELVLETAKVSRDSLQKHRRHGQAGSGRALRSEDWW